MPDEWMQSGATSAFFGGLAIAPLSLLMLDYDGTLAPFTPRRFEAVPYPGVKERLRHLIALPRARVMMISGRKATELRDLLDLGQPIEIWGSHGREYLRVDGTCIMEALTPYEQTELARVRDALREEFSGDVVEVKPNSVAVHWRLAGAGEEVRIRERMTELCRHLETLQKADGSHANDGTLQLLAFDGGLELRAGRVNKGHAVRKILSQFPAGTPAAFLGDDATDEDAFAVLRERGLAVLVRQERRPSLAALWLRPPSELLLFLDAWIAAVEVPR